ncbi:hypothetical protein [Erwinia piriflorinigrans]|uniref:Uncharacterized protein n=1 Tax=Erwinia piriflorinigrans CFBP 5888 TaxID=1161919 RepID=V5Z4N8_9GAMM|nr:hypothetical protein [Erwinia piriflorinigrans]CCG86291.1 putative protein T09B9,4 [Erwinia piriflorinigrans CFBP 5888]
MTVNFINKDIIKVHLTNFTRGNISSKTFHSILDQIKKVDNIPKSVEKALSKKAERHPDLKARISYAYHNRADNIYNAGIERQNEILKNETTNTDDSERRLYKLSREMFNNSSFLFRIKVSSMFEKGFSYLTPGETNAELCKAKSKLSIAKGIISKDTYHQTGYNREKITAKIERLTQEVSDLENKYLEDKYTLTKAIISTAEANPHLLSHKMESCLKNIEDEINKYLATPYISKQVKSNIEKLTRLKNENQEQMEGIDGLISLTAANAVIRDTNTVLRGTYGHHNKMNEKIEYIMTTENKKRKEMADKISNHSKMNAKNTAVKDEVIKLPDVPTHKPNLTRNNWVKIKTPEG